MRLVVLRKSKKGLSEMFWIIIGIVIGMAIAAIFLISFIRSESGTKKLETCSLFSFGDNRQGYCAASEAQCRSQGGSVNPLFPKGNCPSASPVCCIGTLPSETGSTGQKPATAAAKKGEVEFWVKAKLDSSGYLAPSDAFQKFDIKDIKAGNTDFKAKKGSSQEMQARGRLDSAFCSIEVVGKGVTKSGSCSADNGPSITYTFDSAADYDITITGYDKSGGTKLAESVADIKVEEVK